MTKSALLIKMIDLLRKNPGIGVDGLASALDRSERTIYRWLSEISYDLKAPLVCENGGYYLGNIQENRKIDLTPQELLALRLSLKSSPFTDSSPIKKYAESAWEKIRDAVPCEKLNKLSDLASTHDVNITTNDSGIDSSIIDNIDSAVSDRKRINIIYRSQRSNEIKNYTIDPYAVVFRRHSWYVVAYSHTHGRIIQLKMARFLRVIDTGIKFKAPKDFSLEKHFEYSWEVWGGDEPTLVKVWFSPEVAEIIKESKRHATQVIHNQNDGSVIYEVTVSGIQEIALWIMSFGKEAKVIEPSNLRDYIIKQAEGILNNYYSQPAFSNAGKLQELVAEK